MKGRSWLDAARWYDRRLDDGLERLLSKIAWSDHEISTADTLAFEEIRRHPDWTDRTGDEIWAALDELAAQGFHFEGAVYDPDEVADRLEHLLALGYLERVTHPAATAYRLRPAFARDPAFRQWDAATA